MDKLKDNSKKYQEGKKGINTMKKNNERTTMRHYMKTSIFILTISISSISFSQISKKNITFEQVGWTLALPENFQVIDSSESSKKVARGLKAMEESNDLKLYVSSTKTLFVGRINSGYFDATLTPFNTDNEDFVATSAHSREMLFKTFESKMPGTTVDSLLTTFLIDGLEFYKFQITALMDRKVLMTMVLLGRHSRGYNINISYLYRDQPTKEEIELCLRDSKFKK